MQIIQKEFQIGLSTQKIIERMHDANVRVPCKKTAHRPMKFFPVGMGEAIHIGFI